MKKLTLALVLLASPSFADIPSKEQTLEFIQTNQLDQNLYNLLAATVPTTEAGQAIFKGCGEVKTERLFQSAYLDLQESMGDAWSGALADIYMRHITTNDLESFAAVEDAGRAEAIAERLMQPEITDDLRTTLSPLVSEAVALHVNSMLDGAQELCAK